MTPAEANQVRRDAAIRRSHRIDRLDFSQLLNFIHRLAAIEPDVVDRVLAEFDANASKSRAQPKLHPLRFYCDPAEQCSLIAYCDPCEWRTRLEDGHTLADLNKLAAQHSGIEQ